VRKEFLSFFLSLLLGRIIENLALKIFPCDLIKVLLLCLLCLLLLVVRKQEAKDVY